jgi:hypothetical protein
VAQTGVSKGADVRKALLDMVLTIRNAHEDRVELSNDRTAVSKWAAVLMLALVTQLAIAQIAALFIFTLAAVSVLGLRAIHEVPFEPPGETGTIRHFTSNAHKSSKTTASNAILSSSQQVVSPMPAMAA